MHVCRRKRKTGLVLPVPATVPVPEQPKANSDHIVSAAHEKPQKSMSRVAKEQDAKYKKTIADFMNCMDIPKWYRGSSAFQTSGADSLLAALQDDSEQQTTFRVEECLQLMGLSPMITSRQIKLLMTLSRRNDLAFLWFLMEAHYKSKKGEVYNLNEQIIMSQIAHLDMIPTLKELDRLLPQRPASPERKLRAKKAPRSPVRSTKVSPYLLKMPRIKRYGPKLTSKPPLLKFKMVYDKYKNPNFVVPNLVNRWFANYEPHPGRRVANRIIKEGIQNAVERSALDANELEETETHKQLKPVLCEHHRILKELEEKLQLELKAMAKKRCDEIWNDAGPKREMRRLRLLGEMEQHVEALMQQFRMLSRSACRCSCVGAPGPKEKAFSLLGECKGAAKTPKRNNAIEPRKGAHVASATKRPLGSIISEDFPDLDGVSIQHFRTSCVSFVVNDATTANGRRKSQLCGATNRESLKRKPSHLFFKSATEYTPWTFNYGNIYNIKPGKVKHSNRCVDPPKPIRRFEEKDVRGLCLKAINSDISLTSDSNPGSAKPTIGKTIDKYVKQIFKDLVEHYNEENPPKAPTGDEIPLNFGRDSYDPDDLPLMLHMLQTCLAWMRRDTRFVLATLPDAHKLPELVNFIRRRYGKLYSAQERQKCMHRSLEIFRALDKISYKIPVPSSKELGSNSSVSYSCREYLIEKSQAIREKYYEQLNHAIMAQSRVFWFAMRPYLFVGDPRNTYFAYMPSRPKDIFRYRIWQSSEFRDIRIHWEARQRQKHRT